MRRSPSLTAPLPRAEALAACAVAVALGAVLVAVLPPGGDTAAHLYRTHLVERGAVVWDTSWYTGHYPLVGYSLLYPSLAAVAGNVPVALAATAATAALFASVALRQWGDAGRGPALAFSLLAPAPLVLGQWPYALGLASALAGVRALQERRRALVAAAGLVALAASPLAFGVLALVLVGSLLGRPRLGRRDAALALVLVLALGANAALVLAFPAPQAYHFPPEQFALALAAALLVALLAYSTSPRSAATGVAALFAGAVVAAFLAPLPLGENVTRPRELLFPFALALALQARLRPVWLAAPAVAASLVYAALPYATFLRGAPHSREHDEAFWREPLEVLARDASPNFRVEAVPAASHWEALYLPREGHALARGWFRQLDLAQNRLLYEAELTRARYETWLRANAVRFVLLPRFRLDQRGAAAEARLLRSGGSGLTEVAQLRDFVLYELPHATPLLTGPGEAAIDVHEHDRVRGRADAAGSYRLRIRHTPHWRVVVGSVCVERSRHGDTLLRMRRAGAFELRARDGPGALVAAVTRRDAAACP